MPHINETPLVGSPERTEEQPESFMNDVISGLSKEQKSIPAKYFYDEAGSVLFDRICELDEYYPTRTEMAIMQENIKEIALQIGSEALLVEYGSGSSLKTRILLKHLNNLAGYVPIDISREHLYQSAERLAVDFPHIPIHPVHADYSTPVVLPVDRGNYKRTVFFFPGSTIGNFDPDEALAFLNRISASAGRGGGLLIGVDLQKDPLVLEAAYNDKEGVTAAFNKNVLSRINRELGADFDLDGFEHKALYNDEAGRIEMHLISQHEQNVHIGEHSFTFRHGETIHTENSHKYTLPQFAALAKRADFKVSRLWTDNRCLFSIHYLTVV
ncbi:MAG: L-histidine N(alpha)-methyltransferase [Rhodothermaceae bacterium]|nr:L-histidine N(alpha)-methyltransferase [Rhodothermaceae bacterium]